MITTGTYRDAPTLTVDVHGTPFAYRRLGPEAGTPVVFLNHLGANLDNWDPRVVDGVAAQRPVITFDNRGVGASRGRTPRSVEAMARDAIDFIRALGFGPVDLLGFSLGGFVAQVVVAREPALVRRLVLAGTGPAGGAGIDKVTSVTVADSVKAALRCRDPKSLLFFTRTANGRDAAGAFLARLKERTVDRDTRVSVSTFRNQLAAIRDWGAQEPADLSNIRQPVLIANGDQDRMVPSSNSTDLARRLPDATLRLYPDSGHGGIFQHHGEFVGEVLAFLGR